MLARWRLVGLAGTLAALLSAGPAAARMDDPLARFEDPLCPGIAGLQVEAAETMVGLIRANAAAAGVLQSADTACAPNLIVNFVSDGAAYLRLMARQGQLQGEVDGAERRKLLSQEGPVRVFMRTRTRSRDGMPVSRGDNLHEPPQTSMWSAHSRIYTPTQTDIHSVLVLVDRSAVASTSLRQLADYVSFRALSPVRPQQLAPGDSILTLFTSGTDDRPQGMTELDRTFLTTLYEDLPNLPSSARLAKLQQNTGREAVPH